jgi:hypothetical protein
MIGLYELMAKWEGRRAEHRRLCSLVSADAIIADVLQDLHDLEQTATIETVSLKEAASATGYHPGSIARLIKRDQVQNYGTKARPRVRLSQLPIKVQGSNRGPKSSGTTLAASALHTGSVTSAVVDNALALDAVTSRLRRPRSA